MTMDGRIAAELLGGTVGGVLQVIVGHPLDTVKVRMQSSTYYRSLWHCLSDTLKQEGAMAFYKGVGPPIVMAGVLNGVLFGTNGTMKRVVAHVCNTRPDALTTPQVLATAWMTAPVYAAFVTPVELIKCRLQVQSSHRAALYKGPFDVIGKIVRSEGFFGLFIGYKVTVMTRLVGSPFYFVSYDFLKKKFVVSHVCWYYLRHLKYPLLAPILARQRTSPGLHSP
eukprot:m.200367 g.200367  ORF g.200367 m.200367 type:complete len:224 (+) comp16854_c3_seq1:199-870(+)